MATAASRVIVNNAKAALPLIRGSLLKRAGANLARSDQKLLFAPAQLLDQLSIGQLLNTKTVDCDRTQAPATAADLLDPKFGVFIQDMRLRPRKEASDDDEDEFDYDSDDFTDDGTLFDVSADEDDSESEEEDDDVPMRRK